MTLPCRFHIYAQPWFAECKRLQFFVGIRVLSVAGVARERKEAWEAFLMRGYPSRRVVVL